MYYWIIDSPLGKLILYENDAALVGLDFEESESQGKPSLSSKREQGKIFQLQRSTLLAQAEMELKEYFQLRRKNFSLPLSPQGTPFQKKIWQLLLKIPYGKTISYSEEAQMFGNGKYTRAVAGANRANPIPIIIPCHRVIAKDGTLWGYASGLKNKQALQDLESQRKL
jgi:methylated-DNA-[protein]-cysteine S-methyltransferase